MITSIIEVLALCGFIFGVACKLPPSLTIFLMNGCFCLPIGWYLYHKLRGINCEHAKRKSTPVDILKEASEPLLHDGSAQTKDSSSKGYLNCILTTASEVLGFIMQLGALVSIAVLLSTDHFYEPSGKAKYHVIATYILIPVTLFIISILWSGWIQELTMRPSGSKTAKQILDERKDREVADLESASELTLGDDKTARFKAGKFMHIYIYIYNYYTHINTHIAIC